MTKVTIQKSTPKTTTKSTKTKAPTKQPTKQPSKESTKQLMKQSPKQPSKQLAKKSVTQEHFSKIDWREFGPGLVIGVDEVGRGCLAGPVYAAAVVFKSDLLADQVTDSKLISEKRREELFDLLLQAHHVGIGSASVEEIDELNILNAALLAMKRAVENLQIESGHVLVDGNKKIPQLKGFEQTTIIKGDLRVAPISAASIIAKVTRDRLMKEFGVKYPAYGFEAHKGYSTLIHKESIAQQGPCEIHRKTFSGVKEYL